MPYSAHDLEMEDRLYESIEEDPAEFDDELFARERWEEWLAEKREEEESESAGEPFLNPELCAACGGVCCRRLPGAAHPSDFGLPGADGESRLLAAIHSGKWAIDWWEGDPRLGIDFDDPEHMSSCYFVRPATKAQEGRIYDGSWGGKCTFLAPGGCQLEPMERPRGCRLLEPVKGAECQDHGFGKHEAALSWLPYQGLLGGLEEDEDDEEEDPTGDFEE